MTGARSLGRRIRAGAPLGIIVAIIGLMAVWGARHLSGFSWSWDEGFLLYAGRMVDRGYGLYDPLWFDYPPLYPLALNLAYDILGRSMAAGRAVTLAASLVALAGTGWLAWEVSRKGWVAAAAVLLLAVAPPFLAESRVSMADIPATSMAVLAVAVALGTQRRARREPWLALAGACFAVSMGIKPTSAYLAAPLLAAAWGNGDETMGVLWRVTPARATRVLALGGGAAGVVALYMLPYDLRAFASQALGTFAASNESHALSLPNNVAKIWAYLTWSKYGPAQYGLPALLALGLVALWRGPRTTSRLAVLLWAAGGTLFWLFHSPLYNHQLVTLLAPLVATAAYGLGTLGDAWRVGRRARWGLAAATLLALALTLGGAGYIWAQNGGFAIPADDDEDEDALVLAEQLRAELPEDAYIVTDSLALAFAADRDLPPWLANLSSRRITSGSLTAEQAISLTQQYDVAAVIFWDDRLEMMPEYVDWVQANYYLADWYGKERRLYLPLSRPEYTEAAYFGGDVALLGYTLDASAADQADGDSDLTLFWRAQTGLTSNYQVLLELVDAQGVECEEYALPLAQGARKTGHWLEGDVVPLSYDIPTGDLEVGSYRVEVGLLDDTAMAGALDGQGRTIYDGTLDLDESILIAAPQPGQAEG